jgi:hypothetical protein
MSNIDQKRQSLALDDIDFDVFQPKQTDNQLSQQDKKTDINQMTTFPSRDYEPEDQINIKGPKYILDRFRKLRKQERYKYSDLLSILMDSYVKDKDS